MNRFSLARFCLLLLFSVKASGQCYPLNIAKKSEIPFTIPKQAMTAEHDALGRPYLYVVGKERGLLVYDISNTSNPVLVDSVPTIGLANMEVMSLSQSGNYVYLALGNVFSNTEKPGMAIIDVTNPLVSNLLSLFIYHIASGCGGVVKAEGNYAYLGGMRRGLIIVDITNKSIPTFVSQFEPSKNWPNPITPDSFKYNARGMEIRGNYVYLCYDAGGLRIIDISNKNNPVEVGKYSNPALYNRPRAYNNIVLDDSLAYVGSDYCGLEILNISNPANITQVGWWNPWNCQSPGNTWFNSKGHINEVKYNKDCKLLFMSAGKSDMQVVNVSNPANPVLCDSFGVSTDTAGVWGVGLYQNQVYLGYIYVPQIPFMPFYSNYSGIKVLNYDLCGMTVKQPYNIICTTFPNPSDGNINLNFKEATYQTAINIYSMQGVKVYSCSLPDGISKYQLHATGISSGTYILAVTGANGDLRQRIIVIK